MDKEVWRQWKETGVKCTDAQTVNKKGNRKISLLFFKGLELPSITSFAAKHAPCYQVHHPSACAAW
jgi:hypothetical protein